MSITGKPHIEFDQVDLSYFTFNRGINSVKDLITGFRWSAPFQKKSILTSISFQINPGEAVGVVGKNGAGKSTLLKAVAGMLEPAAGIITIRGKVAPILAIGAGVEMELTGYENIAFTGSLMGYSREQLVELKEEIASFSELSPEVLNTPLKTYSTGMLSRLSFSVAVAAQPEILIVDEVLAVGDQGFQQKCIDRIQAIKAAGGTILFVSHSVADIRRICDRVICLEEGKLVHDGAVEQGIARYENLF